MNPALAFPGSCAITPASKWRKERLFKLPGLPTVALVLFLACQFTGRASTNITTASFASLQSAVAVGGTITLSFDGTIATTNSLIISNNTVLLTLTNSVTISGGPSNRLFQVLTNVSLTVSNLTLSGGHSISTNGANGANGTNGSGGSNGTDGGGGNAGIDGLGGAIFNQGSTFAFACLFLTNTAGGSAGGAGGIGGSGDFTEGNGGNGGNGGRSFGGGIYNLGTLVLSNCTLAGNGTIGGSGGLGGTSGTNGGGIPGFPGAGGAGGTAAGGGLYNLGTATITGCTFAFNFSEAGNSQAAGPPKANQQGSPGLAGAAGAGGGIFNLGTNTIVNCTFDQNIVIGGAGGNGGDSPDGFNGGNGGNGGPGLGGGFYNEAGALVNLTNCTFAEGTAKGGTNGVGGTGPSNGGNGSLGLALGANLFNNGGVFNLKNSIVAYPTNAPNVSGAITDLNNNLSSDASGGFTQINSFTNLDPLLMPLTTNGGPTLTMELTAGSPAIHAIHDGSSPPLDQRGFLRSQFGALTDVGAVEFGAFSISGKVTLAGGGGDSGASISVNNTNIVPAQTDAGGNFSLAGLNAGTYILTPQQVGFTFTPTNFTVTVPPNTNNVNFTASVAAYTISGQIILAGTASPFTNSATIVATGTNAADTFTNQTDATGTYSFNNLPADTYTLVPVVVPGVTFSSTNPTVTVPPGTNVNFSANVTLSVISGNVTLSGAAYAGAAVVATGTNGFHVSQSFTNLTDANGNYSFPNLLGGAYVIAPKPVTGVSYAPVSSAKSVPPSFANVNFAGTLILSTYNVFGQITLGTNGPAYANVTVLAKGTNNANLPVSFSTNSDSGGTYFLTGLPAGTYVITPQPAGFFVPASFAVTLPPGTNMNFVGLTATNSSLLISQTGGSSLVKLSFATWVPNLTYRIQASTNLINWQDIDTVTPATNTIIIPVATNGFPTRYFRAVSP